MAKRKKEDEAPPGTPAWMATFSDLMNLLLCFFVLLFSMSSVDVAKYEQVVASFNNNFSIFEKGGSAVGEGELVSSGVSQLSELDDYFTNAGIPIEAEEQDILAQITKKNEEFYKMLAEELSQKIEKYKLEDYLNVSYTSNYVNLSMSGGVLFDSGKAEIKQGAIPIIDKIGDILKRYDSFLIEVEGHTDSLPISNGIYKNNLRLSIDRAAVVQEYLIQVKNLNPVTLKSSGRGEYEPIVSNDTESNRAKNRRVEFRIYKP